MARTIAWPPVIVGGRLTWIEGAEATAQVVRHAAIGGRTANPHAASEPGFEIFGPLQSARHEAIRARLEARMAGLEADRRARLASVSIEDRAETGERIIAVSYDDLETGRRQDLEVSGG